MKAGKSFNFKAQKLKIKYECSADNKIYSSTVMQGKRKLCE